MNRNVLNAYAKLIVEFGVNVSEGQTVLIFAPVECHALARMIAEYAYKRKAKDVEIKYTDRIIDKLKLVSSDVEVLKDIPQWKADMREYYAGKNATIISINYVVPDQFGDVDGMRLRELQRAKSKAYRNFMKIVMKGECPWLSVVYPSIPWAKKIFPGLEENQALQKLWEFLIKAIRLDQPNPVKAWQDHKRNIDNKKSFLNQMQFKKLIYKNKLGSNLTVEMPENHVWVGVSAKTSAGFEYLFNIPTEEIFSLPNKYQVNGTLISSRPLNYYGKTVADFVFEFKDGKIVNYSAKVGQDVLDNIFAIDEGAKYLGEVALVPHDSPISNMNVMFYNTLFDENASCHFALGRAYAYCIKNGTQLSPEELDHQGVNRSSVHIDFMIGTADLSIMGVDRNDNQVQIFKDGNWAF